MANKTHVLDQIKINGALEELLAKSNGENVTVTYDGTEQTLTSALAAILLKTNSLPTTDSVNTAITTAISGLIDGAPETYNTLKEIADYIASDKTAMDTLNAAISGKADKTAFEAVKATVDAFGSLASKSVVSESDLDSVLAAKVNSVSGASHTHSNKTVLDGITAEKVGEWDGKAGTNVATTAANGLMSAADKTRLDGIRGVRYGTSVPDDMQDGELFIKVIDPYGIPTHTPSSGNEYPPEG